MEGSEVVSGIIALLLLGGAIAGTIWLIGEVLKLMGRLARAVAPYVFMGLGAFVLFSVFQADAANAATISVPAGVIVGATRAALVGF